MTTQAGKVPQKILVTGGCGFLGKYLVHEFAREDVVTLGLSQDDMLQCDLSVAEPRFDDRFDTVIHAAGNITEEHAIAVNLDGTKRLCKALSSRPPRQFVFISSVAVYGKESGTEIDESCLTRPTSNYGQSKLAAEQYLTAWSKEYGVTLSILRPSLIVGTGMKGTLGRMAKGIDEGYYFHIQGNEARRSVIHAKDVASLARAIAPTGGTYNLSDGTNPTVHELAEAIARRIGHKRIFTLSRKLFNIMAWIGDHLHILPFSSRQLRQLTETLTFDSRLIFDKTGRKPINVTDYLRTHDYDNDDI